MNTEKESLCSLLQKLQKKVNDEIFEGDTPKKGTPSYLWNLRDTIDYSLKKCKKE